MLDLSSCKLITLHEYECEKESSSKHSSLHVLSSGYAFENTFYNHLWYVKVSDPGVI